MVDREGMTEQSNFSTKIQHDGLVKGCCITKSLPLSEWGFIETNPLFCGWFAGGLID